MTTDHPITPPPELVQQWASESLATQHLCTQAARWGADQELEACCDVLAEKSFAGQATLLREWRRPKPPSLKEQAIIELSNLVGDLRRHGLGYSDDTIRRALEQLDD